MEDDDDEDEDMESDMEDDDEVPDLAGEGDDDDDEPPMLAKKQDAGSKKSAKSAKVAESDDEDEEMEDEEWEDEDEDDEEEINDTCDIILDDDVEKGEEITRHYGPYPNKVLLSKYGFAEEDNPHDTVTIQLEMVRQTAEKILKDEKLVEERIQWFLETEDAFIGEDGDDEEGGCCGGEDHDHGHDHDHDHGHSHEAKGHQHSSDGDCCAPKDKKSGSKSEDSAHEEEEEEDEDEEMDEDEQEEDFPRDIMYMMHDGSVDDRLLMLLNVLFMEKSRFEKAREDMDMAMEYFNDIFVRREREEHGDDEDSEMESEDEEDAGEKPAKIELKPRDAEGKRVRKAVLEAILALVRIRADAFGVSEKTTAEQDLAKLKKVQYCR